MSLSEAENGARASPRRWSNVKWAEAGQLADLLGDGAIDRTEVALAPHDWWSAKVAGGEMAAALRFLAMALPRLDAIAWAARFVEEGGMETPLERQGLDAAARWIQSPDDDHRRAVWGIAEDVDGPVGYLATAIFFSGGSIAPADCDEVPPPPAVCGRAVAGSILAAAHRTGAPDALIRSALEAGERIATGAEARR